MRNDITPMQLSFRHPARQIKGTPCASACSDDVKGNAKSIAEAIGHPIISFVQILSPCVTFSPDQRQWKTKVHPPPVDFTTNASQAARRVMTDDGFNIGVLYKGSREKYAQSVEPDIRCERDLDAEFLV